MVIMALALGGETYVAADGMEEVAVTALRSPALQSKIIGNDAAISREALALIAPGHIQQALQRIPGVNLHHNSGQEYLPAVRSPVLTGAGACGSFLMAEDGIALRPAGFCNVNELFEAHSEQARRIEVIRGPSVALYGSNALHGVINVITPGVGETDDQLSVEAGSDQFQRYRLNTNFDNVAIAFTGASEDSFRDASGVDQQKLTLRTRHQLAGIQVEGGATLTNLNQETAGYIEGTDAYKEGDLARSNPNPEAFRDARAARVWVRLSDDSGDPDWVITPYARYSEMDFLMHFLPGAPLEENGQKSVGVQSAFYGGGERSSWVAGVDLEVVDGWLKQSQSSPTEGSPFLVETIPAGEHYDYGVDAIQMGPFIHWNYQLAEQWQLSAGLRYEWMEYDYDNRMIAGRTRDDGTACGFGGCRYSRPPDSTDSFENLSPKLGVSYTPAEGHRLHLTYARGFRAPQAVELYRLQRDQQVADLESEQLDSVELGYRGSVGDLDLEVLAYAMKKRDIIFRDSDFFNVSAGRTRHRGVEISLAYALSDTLSVIVSGTEARHEYDYDDVQSGVNINGNDVDSAPRHFANTVLRWQRGDLATAELEWMYMGSYYTDPENRHQYDGHDLLNLFGEVNVTPALRLFGRVTNLLDTEYADRADYTSFSGDRYIPGAPRSIYAGISYSW